MRTPSASAAALTVDLQNAAEVDELPSAGEISGWLQRALQRVAGSSATHYEVSVRIVGVEEMQALNARYCHKDRPTNVLAFPVEGQITAAIRGDGPRLLGDVVLCAAVIAREAREQAKTAAAHWGHMLVHGLLHLLGYDHDSSKSAAEMEALEIEILATAGIDNPYQAAKPA